MSTGTSLRVAAKDACVMDVLKRSSPTTPLIRTRLTRVTNGTFGARVRARGTTESRAFSTAALAMRGTRLRTWAAGLLIG